MYFRKVVVAVSGGVDSAVASLLLKKKDNSGTLVIVVEPVVDSGSLGEVDHSVLDPNFEMSDADDLNDGMKFMYKLQCDYLQALLKNDFESTSRALRQLLATLRLSSCFDVLGVFMRNWDEVEEHGNCSVAQDFKDAEWVCCKMGIPFHCVNFVKEYWIEVFRYK